MGQRAASINMLNKTAMMMYNVTALKHVRVLLDGLVGAFPYVKPVEFGTTVHYLH